MFPTSTMLNYIFWMVIGALQVLVVMGAREWALEKGIRLSWWKWLAAYGWFASFCLVIAGGFTLHGELEGNAGWYFIGVFGTVHIVAAAVLAKLLVCKEAA